MSIKLQIVSDWAQRRYSEGNVSSESEFVPEDVLPPAFGFCRSAIDTEIDNATRSTTKSPRNAIQGEWLKEVVCELTERDCSCSGGIYYYDLPTDLNFMTLSQDLGLYDITFSCSPKPHRVKIDAFSNLTRDDLAILGTAWALVDRRIYFSNPVNDKITYRYVADCFNLLDTRAFLPTDILPLPSKYEAKFWEYMEKWLQDKIGRDITAEGADTVNTK
jgi:hypothetical protein